MVRVRLVTEQGEYVATAIIPPFQSMPYVLIWGSRTFYMSRPGSPNIQPIYRECFAVMVVQHDFEDR